jgi:hypothetical protein
MEYFGIDIAAIQARCKEVGLQHVRFPVRDFDPFDLRLKLPKAVARLAKAHTAGEGAVYIHCTAGKHTMAVLIFIFFVFFLSFFFTELLLWYIEVWCCCCSHCNFEVATLRQTELIPHVEPLADALLPFVHAPCTVWLQAWAVPLPRH